MIQSFAWAGPKASFKSILDEYRYAVTVEWDQKDQAQFEAIKAKFSSDLTQLVEDENLSSKDLQNFLRANARDLSLNESTLTTLENADGSLNVARAQDLLNKNADALYLQGSSWTALDTLKWGIGVLVVFEIVVLIVTAREDKCPNPEYYANNIPYGCIYE